MCGIFGVASPQVDINFFTKVLRATLSRRGPDEEGFYQDKNIILGHRRLSIIDLTEGQQPIFNEDKTKLIVYNGEIYNFKELKTELLRQGHVFKTNSDTEVIIHLHEQYPPDEAVNKLNGIFAYAIWDIKSQELLLVRDRFGVKPLYYTPQKNSFVFASQVNSIAEYNSRNLDIDQQSLQQYLFFEFIPAPRSIYRQVYKLQAGHYLLWKNQKYQEKKYYQAPKPELLAVSESAIIDQLKELIASAVKYQLVSDVPLGVFLSGGIDSSIITYYAQKYHNGPLDTFSVGFQEKSYDESRYYDKVSNILNIKNHSITMTSAQVLGALDEVMDMLDEPLGDPSILPTYLLSKFTRQKVTVALSGDGADELFGGYPTYFAHDYARFYQKVPQYLRQLLNYFVSKLPVSHRNISLDYKLKRFVQGFNYSPALQHQIWMGGFALEELKQVFIAKVEESSLFEPITRRKFRDFIEQDFYLYLQDDILVKADRASMMNSLEVRVPFLDHRIVEFAAGLDYKYKVRGFTTKYILRQILKDVFPAAITRRPKKGFGIPVSKWFKHELREVFLGALQNSEFFEHKKILKMFELHLSDKINYRKQLWLILVFNLWRNKQLKKV